jgi:uncharacterized protein YhbP (UPF0306 family)
VEEIYPIPPNRSDSASLARALAAREKTMTLATAEDDVPWAAPVYYAYWNSAFWFFSAPESRHIREALACGRAAAAIYADSSSWRQIKGLQMSGVVEPAGGSREMAGAFKAYLDKFSFVGELFHTGGPPGLDLFLQRFGVRLYYFQPSLVYYLDNAIRFGFRQEVDL